MRRSLVLCLAILLIALPALAQSAMLQATPASPDPLMGTWSGLFRAGDDSKSAALRFDVNKKGDKVVFLDLPDLKFHNLGPFPLQREGENYVGGGFNLKLSEAGSVAGTLTFDGNDLSFELKRGELPAPTPAPPFTGHVAQPVWTFKTSAALWSSPTVADGVVYFGGSDGSIYALKTSSGKQVWQFKTGGAVMGRATIEGSYIYSLSDDGYLYKLERRSPKLVWRFDTHGGTIKRDLPNPKTEGYDHQTSAATVSNGTVYIGSADGKLYAIDDKSGREKWHFETKGIVRSIPAVANGQVFIGSYDHNVYAVDAEKGSLRWQFDTKQAVVSTPLVVDGAVYLGGRCSNLFAFDAATGRIKWKFFYWTSWVESSARFREGKLYIGSSDAQQLFAIDAATGKRSWNVNLDGSVWSSPAVTDEHVFIGVVGAVPYFIPHHGGFFAVDRANGKVAWRFPMSEIPGSMDSGVASSPAMDNANGLVLFGGLDGVFYAFKTAG
ncbi:MAG TPA: PQQ-binding-like beta-propeller repeat protein [Pyrinomonadaceae bacterium]|nr:PQQ-binding-like beta-propeller repeat protein [Pyrinomonadaceae bacterium]